MRSHRAGVIVRRIGSETVVYDRDRHRAHCLSPLAAAVWREHDGRRSAAEVAARLSAGRDEPVGEDVVRVALRRLARAGLAEPGAGRQLDAESKGLGASQRLARRLALRRVAGLAGLAVLTLATPSPAQVAATCLPNGGGPCTSSAQCCNNCCNANNNRCTGGGPCLAGAGAIRR